MSSHARRGLDAAPARCRASRSGSASSSGLKWEGANPTGSFKDRGMAVAVSTALEPARRGHLRVDREHRRVGGRLRGARRACRVVVLQPAAASRAGSSRRRVAVGASVLEVAAASTRRSLAARELAEVEGHVHVNSLNPDRIEGQKTAARRDRRAARRPARRARAAVRRGRQHGRVRAGVRRERRAADASSLGEAAQRRDDRRDGDPHRRARAPRRGRRLRSSAPAASRARSPRTRSRAAWRALAHEEGVFCEPASAAGSRASRPARARHAVVCVVTGHGLKDPRRPRASARRTGRRPRTRMPIEAAR